VIKWLEREKKKGRKRGRKRVKKWIQRIDMKEGALHRQLGIPADKKIPVRLLQKIKNAEIGDKVRWGNKTYKVTRLLKKRAVLALTLKKIAKRR